MSGRKRDPKVVGVVQEPPALVVGDDTSSFDEVDGGPGGDREEDED